MSLHKELDYTSKIREIAGVQFSVLSPEEIKQRSVVHVTKTLLYDSNNDPIIGGLFDPRMGVIDHGKICPTDGMDNRFCPGYFGHIELAKPVFHIQYLPLILKILKCVCFRCSKLLINKEDPEIKDILKILKGRNRWNYIIDRCSKVKICGNETDDGCGALQPTKIFKETNSLCKIYCEWKEKKDKGIEELLEEEKKMLLTPEIVLKIFRRISDEDCEVMGFSRKWCRPDWLVCTVLPVSPPAVRPSIRQFGGQRSEDDITHKLHDIIKTNNHLKKKLQSEKSLENTIDDWVQVLQYHVATLVDNELPGVNPSAHRSGRVLKTLRQRLKGKEGRIRGNLMGKRVDFSSRSVITPDPNIGIDELGVPYKIAMNLTYPEIVTEYNINKLYKYVRNGPFKHPGAKSIKRAIDGRTTSLQHTDLDSITLSYGDVVHRHLVDGDTVLFNRQPSLHKMSMMGHKIKVMDYFTFRLNVSTTKPYNADFDGDEMNMHVPQSLQTRVELEKLTYVPKQIISPRVHTPVIGLFQDSMLGLNRITMNGVFLTKTEMMNILIYIPSFTGKLPKPEQSDPQRWSGRQLVSFAIPKGVNMNMKNKSFDEDLPGGDTLNRVIIKDGELIQGCIDNKIMDSGSKGLIHMVFNDFGHMACKHLLDDLQNIVTRYIVLTGFSVGISDLIADRETNEKIKNTIVKKKKDVSKLVQQVHQQMFENNGTDTVSNEFEKSVNNILNKAIADAGKIGLNSLSKDNRMTNMVSSGSKGKPINIAQMVACLGQQNVDGKRIPNGYNNRALPHFTKYNVSPEARGFVENSFINGLSPQEFFFHAMGGREGLIDTAVKTSETGYIQRKLIKAMEDSKIFHDLSVRNAGGNIIQFLYGEDGMDYSKIENQQVEYFNSNMAKVERDHKFAGNEDYSLFMNGKAVNEMKKTKGYKNIINGYFKQISEDFRNMREYIFKNYRDSGVTYPINLNRLISNIKTQFEIQSTMLSDLNPVYVINRVNKLTSGLRVNDSDGGVLLLQILLRANLSPKHLIKVHKFNRIAFDYLIANIEMQFEKALVEPGEMVGPIAAQSIGEPATQMTLNTFHFAGVSEKSNVTRGVPRLKELLHISKSIKAPSLTIFLDDDNRYIKNNALNIKKKIELTSLKDITKSMRIFYDPHDYNTNVEDDRELLQIYRVFNEMDSVLNENKEGSEWVIRFELDKQKMMDNDITMEDVYHRINMVYSDDISCVYTDDNSSKLIFRIRLLRLKKADPEKLNDLTALKAYAKNMRDKIIIKGITDINSVSMFINKENFVHKNKGYEQKDEWVLDTSGINLMEVLRCPGIDPNRTISNDIYEVYEMFGIEAAKRVLMKEIKEVIKGGGSYVNYRHLSLLVDTMTNRGYLMSIDRFGINRGNIGPLAKCSFEETTDQLFKASIFGELDKLNGVSSNIMMGQIPKCGTGESDILIDETKLLEIPAEKLVDDTDMSQWDDVGYCDTEVNMEFNMDLSGAGAVDPSKVVKTKLVN